MVEAERGAGFLGGVHRRVGVLQELAEVAPVARIERDADRGADGERAAFDDEGAAEDREQPLAERRRLVARFEPVPEQREVIAAQPRQQVLAPQRVTQPLGHRAQQRIAGGMAERFVHQLEAVQIDAQQRELRARARRAEDRLAGALAEQAPAGEAGERIAARELLDASLGVLARSDVGGGAAVAGPAPLGVVQRHAGERLPEDAAGLGHHAMHQVAKRLAVTAMVREPVAHRPLFAERHELR